jgi:3-methylcrotonyl-CoA carboxylase alpha subunit
VARAADRWRIEIGEEVWVAAVVAQRSHQLTLELNGHQIERFSVARDDTSLLIVWRGMSFRLAPAAALSVDTLAGHTGQLHGHASLAAPMPGTVIKVLAEEGQAVAAQQPLVVLEAMKMEHVVVAPYNGVVRKLPYRPGALVAKGAALVELDEEPST